MRVYVGQTRSSSLIKRLEEMGFGELVCGPTEFPPRRLPYAVDNERFKVFTGSVAEADWEARFQRLLIGVSCSKAKPDFLVVPDIVAGGQDSLRFSLDWRPRLGFVGCPLYLAVQDGMQASDVEPVMGKFAGLFVGGSLNWKLKTGRAWCELARGAGLRCHLGRIGTWRRLRWARRIGADSVDSCLPLWSEENLQNFLKGLSTEQHELELEALAC